MKLTIRSAIFGAALSLIAGSAFAQATSSATGTGSVKIITPIAVSQTRGLDFGTIVRPGASATTSVGADATGAVGGTAVHVPSAAAPHSGVYNVTGENGYTFTIAIDPTLTLTRSGGSETLSVTLSQSDTTGTLGTTHSTTSGVANYYVGGNFSLDQNTVVGTYNGNFTTTVAYN